jgi:nucleoside 2-deoxyribosyltransferase
MTTIYFAGPLFTQAERTWNETVVAGLRAAGFRVVLPQERGAAIVTAGEPLPVARLYELALEGIDEADVVVAVLDGPDPDSGTCFECGYAHAHGKPIVGVRTDFRLGGDDAALNVNLMLSQSCATIVRVDSDRTADAVGAIANAVQAVRPSTSGSAHRG